MTGLQIEFRLYLKTNGKAVKCFREEGDTSCVLFFFFFLSFQLQYQNTLMGAGVDVARSVGRLL